MGAPRSHETPRALGRHAMTRLVARILLAMLIVPICGAVVVGFVALWMTRNRPPTAFGFLGMWFTVYAVVGAYWLLLWYRSVRWTAVRIVATVAAAVAALLFSTVVGTVLSNTFAGMGAPPVHILIAGGFAPILWVLGTILIWRESPVERAARLAGGAVVCPVCGYNLTGLAEARCPECGTTFTLDQLFASQDARGEGLPQDR
ncbi:MAG: hypothetical protein CHACPFDD_00055 [Phycisphaerae bacterium]|nr:hypothetical protein [Phycisphaerae bacterium]